MASPSESRRSGVNRRNLLQATGLTAAVAMAPGAARTALAEGPSSSPAMRRLRAVAPRKGSPALPGLGIIAFNRMGFGPRPGDLAAFGALGATNSERLAAYVAQQLDPDSLDDSELDARLAEAGFESLGLSSNPDTYLATLWDWYINDQAPSGNTSSSVPRDELTRATFMRAMYSRKQLVEVLADFWLNHFNVNINHSSYARVAFPHFDMVIRQDIMGRFRDMLESVAMSTSMLYYLDNYTSSNAGPNENFSREVFELHTLGAENYFGVIQQNEVPTDGNGVPVGYVDADIFEATRCFTGWSFSYGASGDGDTGLFYYRPDWHDRFQKNVLGVFIPQDQPVLKDGRDVLDALAAHPGTGRYIARKLCRRLIADDPPQNVIDAAAAVFTDQWQASDQLKQVYEVILLSDEFRDTWGEKIKRPFEIAVSAMRAAGADFTLRMDDSDTNSFLWRYDDTGQELFTWPTPDGFPDEREAWQSMTPRVMSWRLCNWLIDFDDDSGNWYLDVLGQTPGGVRTPNELADFWIDRILQRPMGTEDRDEIVQFIAQGFNPDFDLDLNDDDTADRVRAMVGLILMSPDFLWR
ncbi:MAG: DUF1800 domain-containing protein [bacterium]|nr:DUF1800 domain-containing protein [bacterium]